MNIRQFIDLTKEKVKECADEIIKTIVKRYQARKERESNKEVKEQVALITDSEALKSLKVLRSYEKQQAKRDSDFRRVLRVQAKVYLARRTASLT